MFCQFLCSCDTNLSCVGMSLRHLETRARENLNRGDINTKRTIKDHLYNYDKCYQPVGRAVARSSLERKV